MNAHTYEHAGSRPCISRIEVRNAYKGAG